MMRLTLRHKIMEKCFERYDGVLASGEKANNKLDLEKIKYDNTLRNWVVRDLAKMAIEFNPEPDFLVGVPSGGTWLAKALSKEIGLPTVDLKKDSDNPSDIVFAKGADRAICILSERGLIIEDIFSRFTSVKRVLEIPEISERAVGAIAIWDRQMEDRNPLEISTHALVNVHLPAVLSEKSALWRYA